VVNTSILWGGSVLRVAPSHVRARRRADTGVAGTPSRLWCAVLGLNQYVRPTYLRSSRPIWPPSWGPSWDHTLSAIVNDLHVCERYARPPQARGLCVTGKTCYRYLLGVKRVSPYPLCFEPR
jgi:hypothetical protein